VPDDRVLGAPGKGWRIAMSTLLTRCLSIAGGATQILLNQVASGELILTAALREPSDPAPDPPATAATSGKITGTKIGAPYAAEAHLLLVPARLPPPPASPWLMPGRGGDTDAHA
jgi:alkylation response protein AidB-like acyl-CoA dehydrogenase